MESIREVKRQGNYDNEPDDDQSGNVHFRSFFLDNNSDNFKSAKSELFDTDEKERQSRVLFCKEFFTKRILLVYLGFFFGMLGLQGKVCVSDEH